MSYSVIQRTAQGLQSGDLGTLSIRFMGLASDHAGDMFRFNSLLFTLMIFDGKWSKSPARLHNMIRFALAFMWFTGPFSCVLLVLLQSNRATQLNLVLFWTWQCLTHIISYHFIISYIWLHCHSRDLFEDKLHVAPHSKWPLSSELRCSHRYSRRTCCEKERGEKRTRRHGEPRTTLIITDPVKSSLKNILKELRNDMAWYGMIWNDI